MIKELSDLAGQHEQVAENMTSLIVKDLQTAVQEVKQERKRVGQKKFRLFLFLSVKIFASTLMTSIFIKKI